MVEFAQVAQLVQDDVIDQRLVDLNELEVERDLSSGRATAPAGLISRRLQPAVGVCGQLSSAGLPLRVRLPLPVAEGMGCLWP